MLPGRRAWGFGDTPKLIEGGRVGKRRVALTMLTEPNDFLGRAWYSNNGRQC